MTKIIKGLSPMLFGVMASAFVLLAVMTTANVAEAARTGVSVTAVAGTNTDTATPVRLLASVTDDGDNSDSVIIELTDGAAGGTFYNANAGACGTVAGLGPQTFTISAGDLNKNFCYQNTTAGTYTVSVQVKDSFGANIGATDTIDITVAVVPCAPQFNVTGPTSIQNTNTGEFFDTVKDALADCDTTDGNTIALTGPITLTEQITLNRPVTLDGNGNTITASFAKTDNDNNSAIGVTADNVTIKDVIISGTGGTNLHGINVYTSTGVLIDGVTVNSINRTALVVNGSNVTINNFSTSGSSWHAINLSQGGGVTDPIVLTVNGISTHTEAAPIPHIYIDNMAQPITVNDTNNQYEIVYEGPNPGNAALTARSYRLYGAGTLELIKSVKNSDGSAYTGSWSFTMTGLPTGAATLTDSTPMAAATFTASTTKTVTESAVTNWAMTGVTCTATNDMGATSTAATTWTSGSNTFDVFVPATTTVSCVVENTYTAPVVTDNNSSGSSSGTRVTSRNGAPRGQVLGASTSAGEYANCKMYLTDYMGTHTVNKPSEVMKLQIFLNAVGIVTPITEVFDAATDRSVRLFQQQYAANILAPWGLTHSTGYVYKTTRWQINNIVCPGIEAYPVL